MTRTHPTIAAILSPDALAVGREAIAYETIARRHAMAANRDPSNAGALISLDHYDRKAARAWKAAAPGREVVVRGRWS